MYAYEPPAWILTVDFLKREKELLSVVKGSRNSVLHNVKLMNIDSEVEFGHAKASLAVSLEALDFRACQT